MTTTKKTGIVHSDAVAVNVAQSNQDTYDRDLIGVVRAGQKSTIGALLMSHLHHARLCRFADAFNDARTAPQPAGKSFSARKFVLDDFAQTAQGEALAQEKAKLSAIKPNARTRDEAERLKLIDNTLNGINTQSERMIATNEGVRALRANGRKVWFNVREADGLVVAVTCYVRREGEDEKGNPHEAEGTAFTISALRNVTAVDFTDTTPTAEVFKLCREYKAPTGSSSNGQAIEPAKLGETVRNIDTSIAGLSLAADGGVSPGARAHLFSLYARLHTMMTVEQRAAALFAFNAEAAPADATQAPAPEATPLAATVAKRQRRKAS